MVLLDVLGGGNVDSRWLFGVFIDPGVCIKLSIFWCIY